MHPAPINISAGSIDTKVGRAGSARAARQPARVLGLQHIYLAGVLRKRKLMSVQSINSQYSEGPRAQGTCHEVVTTEYSTANRTGFGQFILREERWHTLSSVLCPLSSVLCPLSSVLTLCCSGCLKCMMIYQKHYNVLQYREGECLAPGPPSAPDARCQEIPGDAAMYTMIRWARSTG
jgi:hypothetical protein